MVDKHILESLNALEEINVEAKSAILSVRPELYVRHNSTVTKFITETKKKFELPNLDHYELSIIVKTIDKHIYTCRAIICELAASVDRDMRVSEVEVFRQRNRKSIAGDAAHQPIPPFSKKVYAKVITPLRLNKQSTHTGVSYSLD